MLRNDLLHQAFSKFFDQEDFHRNSFLPLTIKLVLNQLATTLLSEDLKLKL